MNVDTMCGWLVRNAHPESLGACARYVRMAIEAGGVSTAGHPVYAKDYAVWLADNGATQIDPGDGYVPQKGDIAVFDGNAAHPYGHICVFCRNYENGNDSWISDFVQRHCSPYKNDSPPVSLFRFPQKK